MTTRFFYLLRFACDFKIEIFNDSLAARIFTKN